MSVPMAITDYVPVVLYLITMMILINDLNGKMRVGCFTIFAGGVVMSFLAGVFKATWKLLYAMGICDFDRLNQCFFPMQATGFILVALALLLMMLGKGKGKKKKDKLLAITAAPAAPAVFSGTFVFVGMLVAGVIAICGVLSALAKKLNKKKLWIFFLIACVGLIGMGYLSSKDFEKPLLNWLAEGLNIISQCSLLWGTISLHRAGLKDLDLAAKPIPAPAAPVVAEEPAAADPVAEATPAEETPWELQESPAKPAAEAAGEVPAEAPEEVPADIPEEAPAEATEAAPDTAEASNPDGRLLW